MGTSGTSFNKQGDLNRLLAQQIEEKMLRDRLAGKTSPEESGGGRMSGGSSGGGGRMSGSVARDPADQAARDKELAMEMAEKARSQREGSENRVKEDTNRADLAEKARAMAAARALQLAQSVR